MTNKHIIDLVVERLTTILQKFTSNFRTKSFSDRGRKQHIWCDKDCDNAKKEKYRWLNIFRVTNDKAILLKFKAATNKFRTIFNRKREQYFKLEKDNLVNSVDDAKQFWKTLKRNVFFIFLLNVFFLF